MVSVEEATLSLGVRTLKLNINRAVEEALAMYRAGARRKLCLNDDPYDDFFFENARPLKKEAAVR